MIDWDRLYTLRSDIGDDDFADVAVLFVAEIAENLDRLSAEPAAATAGDFHFLRGSAANLGFVGLAEACQAAEAACQAGRRPDVDAVAVRFRDSLAAPQ